MQQYYQYQATTEPSVSSAGQAYTSLTPSEVDAVTQALASAAANANTASKSVNAASKITTTIGKRKQVKNACSKCVIIFSFLCAHEKKKIFFAWFLFVVVDAH